MDFHVGQNIATVISLSDGTASLYTTSTFGIIGGAGHAPVRDAARRFVKAADRYFDDTSPISSHPYPAKDKVRFYLLGYEGLRSVEVDEAPIYAGTGKFSPLFGEGQNVLTELRLAHERMGGAPTDKPANH